MSIKTKDILKKLESAQIKLDSKQKEFLESKEELDDKELEKITGGMSMDEFVKMLSGYCSSFTPFSENSERMCVYCQNIRSTLGYFNFVC